jgi:hypothetical protein
MQDQRAMQGFFPIVAGRDVRVERAGGVAFLARRSLTVQQGGGQWLIAGGDLRIQQGGGAALIAKRAHVERGFVAALFGWNVTIAPGSRVLLRAAPAVAMAAASGFLLGWLVGRSGRAEEGGEVGSQNCHHQRRDTTTDAAMV